MTYTVNGIDISVWQSPSSDGSNMDGCEFVGIRACYGTSPDGSYAAHEANARAHGAVVIAYCFGRFGNGPSQADALLATAPHADLYALDLEADAGNPAMTGAQAAAFLAHAKASTGKRVGLYHSESGFPTGLGQEFNWVAKWGSTPPSIPWAFWQWQGSPLDRDYYNGTLDSLRALAGLVTAPPNEPVTYTVRLTARTPYYVRPDGTRLGTIGAYSYTCIRVKSGGHWWYQVVGPSKSSILHRWMPAEPTMVVTPL